MSGRYFFLDQTPDKKLNPGFFIAEGPVFSEFSIGARAENGPGDYLARRVLKLVRRAAYRDRDETRKMGRARPNRTPTAWSRRPALRGRFHTGKVTSARIAMRSRNYLTSAASAFRALTRRAPGQTLRQPRRSCTLRAGRRHWLKAAPASDVPRRQRPACDAVR